VSSQIATRPLAQFRALHLVLLAVTPVLPALHASDRSLLLEANTAFASRYVYRGVERSAENWQFAVEGENAGWRGRVGAVQNFDADATAEIQSTLGYVWPIGGNWALAARGTHFWYVDAPVEGAPSHSFEGSVELSWDFPGKWRPAVEFAYDIGFRSRAVELSLARTFSYAPWRTALEFRAYGGHVIGEDILPDTTGSGTYDAYTYFGANSRLRYRINVQWDARLELSMARTINQAPAWSPLGSRSGARAWIRIGAVLRF